MARRSLDGARVLVTGASSGIGAALACELASRGARLLLTARRQARLEALADRLPAGSERHVITGDITDEATRGALLSRVSEVWGGLDALINNAGVGALGSFAEADPQRLRTIMEVNFFAPTELARAALPLLRRGNRPILVNVGSVLGHRGVPGKVEYCASKFALHGLSDAWRTELAREGIDLLLASPSTTSSEFFDNVLQGAEQGRGRAGRGMSPEKVARKIARAMCRGQHEVILSWGGRFLVWLDRLAPSLAHRLVTRFG
jgi:short-subunit dehydrogenase